MKSKLTAVDDVLQFVGVQLDGLNNRSPLMDTVELKMAPPSSFRSVTVLGRAEFLGNLNASLVNGLNVFHFFKDSLMYDG